MIITIHDQQEHPFIITYSLFYPFVSTISVITVQLHNNTSFFVDAPPNF